MTKRALKESDEKGFAPLSREKFSELLKVHSEIFEDHGEGISLNPAFEEFASNYVCEGIGNCEEEARAKGYKWGWVMMMVEIETIASYVIEEIDEETLFYLSEIVRGIKYVKMNSQEQNFLREVVV